MIMKWQTVAIVALLFLLLATLNTARGDLVVSNGEPVAKFQYIQSPTNTSYSSRLLFLNITSFLADAQWQFDYSLTYSLDGKENQTIPLQIHNYEYHGYSMPYFKIISAEVRLPELSESSHYLTVFLNLLNSSNAMNPPTGEIFYDKETVYFTINDGQPPKISDLSIGNFSYKQTVLSLNFTTDEPSSWTAYNLDSTANVTVNQNMTLSNLAHGSHTLTVYANDTVGNMGSRTVNFTVEKPQTEIFGNPSIILVIAVLVTIVCLVIGLLLVRRLRKNR